MHQGLAALGKPAEEASLGPGWKEQPLQGGVWDVGASVTALRQCDGITRGHASLTGHLSNSNSQITGRLIRQLLTLLLSKGNAEQRVTFIEGEKVGRWNLEKNKGSEK